MIYFCIDCEASGQLPPFYNLLSIGATVVAPREDYHEIGESLYVELKPIFPGFDPDAMAVCGLDADRLRREGVEPEQAMRRLTAWVEEHNSRSQDRPVFVGHNAVFDWAYIASHDFLVAEAGKFGAGNVKAEHTTPGQPPELGKPTKARFPLQARSEIDADPNQIWLHATLYWGGKKQHSYKRNIAHVYESSPGSFF